ncbi:hypothetical protein [Xenorhabdus cabanillasii]|uniref:Membrane-associated Zn-dependent protease 1 n=2 Tax=Xenorhabdus cabanillasii TaxID=351673 RepID=A0A3D9UL81_9GAMM|nr:hypothetical protein [Xenorhabdus cabanillasii]PHM77752.1 membrane-associated Zn-dependent protease 1 [Xenorhabdus cabanillasii JM26]REF27355.1 hypothetical protein BDD26_2126 [Xenorhabdus cabanillasii]CDL86141.1 conserved exported hypothetical protein [Xenorhabdus cabanillasii JM26]
MRWRGYTYRTMLILLASCLFSPTLWAQGEAHLLFHMGLGANGKFFVGGTLQNKGDQPVAGGYLAILPLNIKCEPQSLIVYSFDSLAPEEKKEFRIPVDIPPSSYHLMGFVAYDDMGFSLPAVDETANIIKDREPNERKACQLARGKSYS